MKTATQHTDIRRLRSQVMSSEAMLRDTLASFQDHDVAVSTLIKVLPEMDWRDGLYSHLGNALGRVPHECLRRVV